MIWDTRLTTRLGKRNIADFPVSYVFRAHSQVKISSSSEKAPLNNFDAKKFHYSWVFLGKLTNCKHDPVCLVIFLYKSSFLLIWRFITALCEIFRPVCQLKLVNLRQNFSKFIEPAATSSFFSRHNVCLNYNVICEYTLK